MFWAEFSWASSWERCSGWLLSGPGTKTWQQAYSGPCWESAGCMDAFWLGRTTFGMTKYGRKSMLAGSTPGSAPGVGNVFPSMIEVGDGKLGLEGTFIMDFLSLLSRNLHSVHGIIKYSIKMGKGAMALKTINVVDALFINQDKVFATLRGCEEFNDRWNM